MGTEMSAGAAEGRPESNGYVAGHGMLYTDMYQLTMAQVYYRQGLAGQSAQFDYFFRRYPDYGGHSAGYCINAGLGWLLDWMAGARFGAEDLAFLRRQRGRTGAPLFDDAFLDWLRREGTFGPLEVDAIPEGRVVHPGVPLAVVRGPLAMGQILETGLLNHLNYQTLVATKAARVRDAGRGQMMLEFGMRRAQGEAANAGARAALIGGADFTSNVEAAQRLGLAPKGTHAHSMVQVFMALGAGELEAFRAYADSYPDDCLLLVDTIDTLGSGVPNAIRVFEELRRRGHEPMGIRLDSGDLAYLAVQAARMLDEAGFPGTSIVLSNDLDELVIWQIIDQIIGEAPRLGLDPDAVIGRLVYGVGTRLITSQGHAALDGVYKLVAVESGGEWRPAIKLSDSPSKIPTPGNKGVWRLYDQRGKATADLLSAGDEDPRQAAEILLRHPSEADVSRTLHAAEICSIEPLLAPAWRGRPAAEAPSMAEMRATRDADLARLDPGVRRIINPHTYHVSLTDRLWRLKQETIHRARGEAPPDAV